MPRSDDDEEWLASGTGDATLNILVQECKGIRGSTGVDVGVRVTISIPGKRASPSLTHTSSPKTQRRQSDISVDHAFKIPSPSSSRAGTVVDWRRVKGRIVLESVG